MKTAYLAIRDQVHYRRDAFHSGLKRLGYKIEPRLPQSLGNPGDLMVIWNRYGNSHRVATQWEQAGGDRKIIVAENGYLGDSLPGKWFAMSLNHHNGAGRWPYHGPERWEKLGIELAPWQFGTEIVLLPQRGIGEPGVAMPMTWPKDTERLIKYCRTRKHPGTNKAAVPLEHDLRRADHVITWASGAAIRALLWGIPAFYAFPKWIGAGASRPIGHHGMVQALRDDSMRWSMFATLAWAQWSIDEVTSGEAFTHLLELL